MRYTMAELETLGGTLHATCLHVERRCRMASEAGDQDTLGRLSDAFERLSDFYWSISTEYMRRSADLVADKRPRPTESVAAWQRRTGRKVYGGVS